MTIELWALFGAVVLGLVHIGCQSFAFKRQVGNAYTVGPRDAALAAAGLAGRLERASRNFGESFPLFAAVVLIAHVASANDGLSAAGALLYLGGRVLYLPAYATGWPWVRTAFWQIAGVGIVLVLASIVL